MVPVSEQYMVSRWNVVITGIYAAKKTDTDTGTLSRIAPGKRYTLRVNWPGFKGLTLCVLTSLATWDKVNFVPLMTCIAE